MDVYLLYHYILLINGKISLSEISVVYYTSSTPIFNTLFVLVSVKWSFKCVLTNSDFELFSHRLKIAVLLFKQGVKL